MKRAVVIVLSLVLLSWVSASADQIVVGELPDTVWVDSIIQGSAPPAPVSPPGAALWPASVDSMILTGMDCSAFPTICFYVDALGADGYPVSGLTADSFCVLQDGDTISSVTVQQLDIDSCVSSVCLVVDLSGSMNTDGKIDSAKAAMHRYVDNMDPLDRVAIVSFATCVDTVIDFTSDTASLHTAIDGLVADGYTAAFDGVWLGVDLTTSEVGSKAVIAFTDGQENRSQSCWPPPDGRYDGSYADDSALIVDLATGAGVTVYTFNLGPIGDTWYNPEAMQAFANGTGGFWSHAPTPGDIDSVYNLVKERLCSRYYFCYESLDTVQNCDWHTTTVCYYDDEEGMCHPCVVGSCQEGNPPPTATCPGDDSLIVCDLSDLCITGFSVTDPCDDLESVTVSPGVLDGDSVCFTPVEGDNLITLIAIDSAGQADTCQTLIHVNVITGPTASCPDGDTLLVCDLSDICLDGFSCSDAVSSTINGVPFGGGSYCFTPVEGDNVLELICVDTCGRADTCQTLIHVDLNQPPYDPTCPSGYDLVLCNLLDSVCATGFFCNGDPDGNLAYSYATGGDLYDSTVCFLPVEGANTITYVCVDSCGDSSYCQTTISVTLDTTGPTVSCPEDDSLTLCELTDICLDGFSSSGADSCWATPGTLTDGTICFTPVEGANTITYTCVDSCGNETSCQTIVYVTIDTTGPTVSCPEDDSLTLCELTDICLDGFTSTGADSCWATPGTLTDGTICFTPVEGANTITYTCVDSCGNETSCQTIVYVTLDTTGPTVSCPPDTSVFVCGREEVCVDGFDSDGDSCWVNVGTLSDGTICFEPDLGDNVIIFTCVDSCGNESSCQTTVTVVADSTGPGVDCPGGGDTILVCDLSGICIDACSSPDPDGDLDSCWAVPGTLSGGSICFTPVEGLNTITQYCADTCGNVDSGQTFVYVILNAAPMVSCPPPDSLFLCELPETYCIGPFTSDDPDDNLSDCDVSNGVLDGDSVCFTPVAGLNTIAYWCIDSCGLADTCETFIWIDTNSEPDPPTCPPDTTVFVCDLGQLCIGGFNCCTDPDGHPVTCEVTPGTLNGNTVCFDPQPGANTLTLTCTDSCGATASCETVINVVVNDTPTVSCPDSLHIVTCFPNDSVCVGPFAADDADDNLASLTLNGEPFTSGDAHCFAPDSGLNLLILTATDSCGAGATCTTKVVIEQDSEENCAQCPIVKIEKTHETHQGQHEFVEITIDSARNLPWGGMGGYDFLIAYDAGALALQAAIPGPPFYDPPPEGCGWEYFVYRFGACGWCAGSCPTGMVRVFGLAETNNGPNHPACFSPDDEPATVFTLDILVTDDRTFECQYVPIKFFWCDCGDNTISDSTGNRLYLDEVIYDYEGNVLWDEMDDANYPEHSRIPWVGAPDSCIDPEPGKPEPIRCIDFWNGGIDIVCADSIDDRGDVNLNGTANEIADAVLFSNYFIQGITVFNVNLDGQIAATDVNADGITLSVADLVYLIRIIVGDADPYVKQAPIAVKAELEDGVLSIGTSLGAAWVIVEGELSPHLLAPQMDMKYHYDAVSNLTRILVYSMHKGRGFEGAFLAGIDGEVVTFEAATYEGAPVTARLKPDHYALYQSYPNPFNPMTTISFALAKAGDYELTIYNTLGREVRTFSGHGRAGVVEIQWNAEGQASGVYYYRLTAGDFTDTRKMVLLK